MPRPHAPLKSSNPVVIKPEPSVEQIAASDTAAIPMIAWGAIGGLSTRVLGSLEVKDLLLRELSYESRLLRSRSFQA
jgi:hypothetical protein